MTRERIVVLFFVLFAITGPAFGIDRLVPNDYPTIQDAIDAADATTNDVVIVANGFYVGPGNYNIDFGGKAITVRSANGPSSCIIDCGTLGRAFLFQTDETAASVVEGFTITNGVVPFYGGAIEFDHASPTISNCIIKENGALDGGGIDCYGGSATIIDCVFVDNIAANFGGAISCYESSPNIINCLITGSQADTSGGAIDCYNSSPVISNCTIVDNASGLSRTGIVAYSGSVPEIKNCIFSDNVDDLVGCSAMYSRLSDWYEDAGVGNIFGNPFFITGPLGDYYLSQKNSGQLWQSPCVNRGTNAAAALSPNGYTTSTKNIPDSSPVDMGYHYPDSGVVAIHTLITGVLGGHGEIDPNHPTPGIEFDAYTQVYLHAVPEPGYRVAGWTGLDDDDMLFGLDYAVIFMDSDKEIYVTFELDVNILTMIVLDGSNGQANGTLTANPPAPGNAYPYGEVVTLTADPNEGYDLVFWAGDVDDPTSTELTNTVTMTGNKTVGVLFGRFYHLDVQVIGGNGGVDPRRGYYLEGTVADITALPVTSSYPDPSYKVKEWVGADVVPGAGELHNTVTMTSDKLVTVEYEHKDTFMLTTSVETSTDSQGAIAPPTGLQYEDDVVTVTAIPDNGFEVAQWFINSVETIPDPNLSINSINVLIDADKLVEVEFQPAIYIINGVTGQIKPERYHTIQAAIDAAVSGLPAIPADIAADLLVDPNNFAAVPGDIVVVSDGLWRGPGNRDLDFGGKWITVRGKGGDPSECVIDCQGAARGFYFHNFESNESIVDGFTIINGNADIGGGILCEDYSSPLIRNCVITNCISNNGGGGAYFVGPSEDNTTIDDLVTIADDLEQLASDAETAATEAETAADEAEAAAAADPDNQELDDAAEEAGDLADDLRDLADEAWQPAIEARRLAIMAETAGGDDGDSAMFVNCKFLQNSATLSGGAIFCSNSSPTFLTSEITGNTATFYYGGGVYAEAESVPEFISCLVNENTSGDIGGSFYLWNSDAIIIFCTIVHNYGRPYAGTEGPKGGVCARDSSPEISNCIIGMNGGPWYYWNAAFPAGDDLYQCDATYSCIENGDDGTGNINDDPLFTTGVFGDFYLSQIRGGQAVDSPCVNAGEQWAFTDAQQPRPDGYNIPPDLTTSIQNHYDIGYADMGYHYPPYDPAEHDPIMYTLTLSVLDPHGELYFEFIDPATGWYTIGTVNYYTSPVTYEYAPGTEIDLRARPDNGYRVSQWYGTDDDLSYNVNNAVTVYENQSVAVEFELRYTRYIHVPGEYTYIQSAIDAARDGDIVMVADGTYVGTGFFVLGKDITITAEYPDDPTKYPVIDCGSGDDPETEEGESYGGFHLVGTGIGRITLKGFIIQNISTGGGTEDDGQDPGDPGFFGSPNLLVDPAIAIYGDHIVENCIIRNCELRGDHGGNGDNGNQDVPTGGYGGYGGDAGGAGIAISFGSPYIKNVLIENCTVIAGDGGGGANGAQYGDGGDGGVPGRAMGAGIFIGRTWYSSLLFLDFDFYYDFYYFDPNTAPVFEDCVVRNCRTVGGNGGDGGDGGQYGYGGFGGLLTYQVEDSSYIYKDMIPYQGDPRRHTAMGGAVYCGENTAATFINCRFENNVTDGGVSGIGGDTTGGFTSQPRKNYNIPSAGAGVFCANGSDTTFTGCQITNNRTTYYYDLLSGDSYTGYGGGICFGAEYADDPDKLDQYLYDYYYYYYNPFVEEDGLSAGQLSGCTIRNNSASLGGGVYGLHLDEFGVYDCSFLDNTAYMGGGLFAHTNINMLVENSNFAGNSVSIYSRQNEPGAPPDDPGGAPLSPEDFYDSIIGTGGGIYVFASDAVFRDCDIITNTASGTGGGIYLAGYPETILDAPKDPNDLILALPLLDNCRIRGNTAGQEGAGVALNHGSETVVQNSLIVRNTTTEPNSVGGGIYSRNSLLTVNNTTIADNTSLYGSGLCVAYESNANVSNSIIWGNRAVLGAQIGVGNIYETYLKSSALEISHSDVGPLYDPNAFIAEDALMSAYSLNVVVSSDAEELVDNIIGSGISVSNVSYTGSHTSSGTFTGGLAAGIGIESGIVLTTGDASLAVPPNTQDYATGVNGLPGDMDLAMLIPGYMTTDATVLEFDFISEGGSLYFSYVFASEEYNEFVNSPFNDVFGFFLDGTNIALVPGSTTQVSINNVNGGGPVFGLAPSNPQFYNNNDLSDGGPFFDIEYDGFTDVFVAVALDLSPGLHHIKLAIADAGDSLLDSAVFILAGSFSDRLDYGPPIHVKNSSVLNGETIYGWAPSVDTWPAGSSNLDDDPLFVDNYFLSHIAASQIADSPCVDTGSDLSSLFGLDTYTTRTDSVPDIDTVDMGFHNELFDVPEYVLTIESGENGTIAPPWQPGTYVLKQFTVVELEAVPDPNYRVLRWTGTDNDSITGSKNTVTMYSDRTVTVEFGSIHPRTLLVPSGYPTIEEAVAEARDGDMIVLAPTPFAPHTVSNVNGIDFKGKKVTLMGTDQDDPEVIAQTIIDCQGTPHFPKRAFHFHNGEDHNTVIWGITIRNAYTVGNLGGSGVIPGEIYPLDYSITPLPPLQANSGVDASGDGYGGAILCENSSSPSFINCVIIDCTVTGGQGGNGLDGYHGALGTDMDGQSGGHGGDGSGNGYGGAIACLEGSSPIITDCTIKNCTARGGMGGRGGNGGNADPGGNGRGSWGGSGGDGFGDGIGGGIYCDEASNPVITGTVFENNVAMPGNAFDGGIQSQTGKTYPDPWDTFSDGMDGFLMTYGGIAGGAAYYTNDQQLNFTNCSFINNKAHDSYTSFDFAYGMEIEEVEVPVYTAGGAIYSEWNNVVTLIGCQFTENVGGAVYSEPYSIVTINDCLFRENATARKEEEVSSIYYYYPYWYLPSSMEAIGRDIPGGALYIDNASIVDIRNTDFEGNVTHGNGGAILLKADAGFKDCTFGGNKATGDGGAIDAYCYVPGTDIVVLNIVFDNCVFTNNQAAWDEDLFENFYYSNFYITSFYYSSFYEQEDYKVGFGGAIHCRDFDVVLDDCYFVDNTALSGGGLYLANGDVTLNGGLIRGNHATGTIYEHYEITDEGSGGGISLMNTTATIRNYTIKNNNADGVNSYGGGIDFYGGGGDIEHKITNCLVVGNEATIGGGGVACNVYVEPKIVNCTFAGNTTEADGFGGAIFCDWSSCPEISNSIFENCSSHAVYEEQIGGNSAVIYSLFNNNADGDFYNAATSQSYTGYDEINKVPGNHDNIDGDPLFVTGTLGGYYLQQNPPSPAVDAGSGPAVNFGLDTYTTDPDGIILDNNGQVDAGYHHVDPATLDPNELTVIVNGHGTATPLSGTYLRGTLVRITALPDDGYQIESWEGTIDDTSKELTNEVLMDSDKEVTITYRHREYLYVGENTQYTTIQRAIDDAKDGDIVVVQTGRYRSTSGGANLWAIRFYGKSITLRGTNPDDAQVVANTIIDNWFVEVENVGSDTVIEGLTFTNGQMEVFSSDITIRNCIFEGNNWTGGNGITLNECSEDGDDGTSIYGASLKIVDSSPEILHCVFKDNSARGGNGSNGNNGCSGQPGGDGGWGGRAYGGAVYCGFSSKPYFLDCSFIDNAAYGGNGGDGGAAGAQNRYGGRGGSWLWSPSQEEPEWWLWWNGWTYLSGSGDKYLRYPITDFFGRYNWQQWVEWFGWDEYNSWDEFMEVWSDLVMDPYDTYEDYWRYSGYGGAVYCEYDSSAKFKGCKFIGNHTEGGLSGLGGPGTSPRKPDNRYNIDTAGGAVFAAHDSDLEFTDCFFSENYSDRSLIGQDDPEVEEPSSDRPSDYYVSYGGAVAYEFDCQVKFVKCEIANNEAGIGGGIYASYSGAEIIDCNFVSNESYHGAGLYAVDSAGVIDNTQFMENTTSIRPAAFEVAFPFEVPEAVLFGKGAGVYSQGSEIDVSNSVFSKNRASASGGGIYYAASDLNNAFTPVLFNSLFHDNSAGRDGGAISANWNTDLDIANCTLADNVASGAMGDGLGYGGGLFVSYDSFVDVTDTIIWDNVGVLGAQIAVGSGDIYGPKTSTVRITYSDIGEPNEPLTTNDISENSGQNDGSTTTEKLIDSQTIYDAFDSGEQTVKVIITLGEPAGLRETTDWDSSQWVSLLRAEITNRQNAMLATLGANEFTLRYLYENQAGFSGEITQEALERLLNNPAVEHIEPVRDLTPMLAQSIPLANATEARLTYDGSGLAVAIVDSGIDYTHPMLGGGGFPNDKVIGGYDVGDNDADPMPSDEPHGTACAGIAAGDLGQVGDYIGGVAHNARLYALKLSGDDGSWPSDAGLRAWDWCITHQNDDPANPIMAMSNSWSRSNIWFEDTAVADDFSPAYTIAAENAVSTGITILASSGNDFRAGTGISWPSAMSNVISVGAVYDITDQVTGYSNTDEILDILAPADPMYTTDMVGEPGYGPGDYWPTFGGTSSACPFAAGCVASLQNAAKAELGHYLTPMKIREKLVGTGDPVTDTKVDITKPRVNLAMAIADLAPSITIYVEPGCTLEGWDPDEQLWDPNTYNLDLDPLFVGPYFLSETGAGQLEPNSPCIDAGSDLASVFGLDEYSTRSDSKRDKSTVDMGYHYLPFGLEQYKLQVNVVVDPFVLTVDPNFDPVAILEPGGPVYKQYTQVRITVPVPPFEFHTVWTGTDDDESNDSSNVVTMSADKLVTIEFESIGYELTVTIEELPAELLADFPNFDRRYTMDPPGRIYYPDTVVQVQVTSPPPGYQVSWQGADDGSVVDPNNYVTMDSDKTVTAAYEPIKTDYYAIICGVSEYYGFGNDLQYPTYDATQFYMKLLSSPEWDSDNIFLLLDSDATRTAVGDAFENLADRIDYDDVFVFYFSGIGTTVADVEPIDEFDNLDECLVTYSGVNIRDDEINEWLSELATDKYAVILDTSFSSGSGVQMLLNPKGIGSDVPGRGDGFAADLKDTAVVVTACKETQVAWESQELRHGLFTYYLLQAMGGKGDWDGNVNGWLSAEESYNYQYISTGSRINGYIEDLAELITITPGTTMDPQLYDEADEINELDFLSVLAEGADPVTYNVPGDAETVQEAVELAKDGDVILLGANTYYGGGIIIDKNITIASTNPDDPDVVALTIINIAEQDGGIAAAMRGVVFGRSTTRDAVLDGVTIQNVDFYANDDPASLHGESIVGGGIAIAYQASPTIRNCVVQNITVNALDGENGTELIENGAGYDGGWAAGGGIYCGVESWPLIVNTIVRNCHANAGNGGNGAPATAMESGGRGGWSGIARGGGVYIDIYAWPTFEHCTITNCSANGGNAGNGGDSGTFDGVYSPAGYGGGWSSEFYAPWQAWEYIGDYRFYSGYGGGVYCEMDSSPKFIDCIISGNNTQGGLSGVGGAVDGTYQMREPYQSYEIPSYGGGIYCAKNSTTEFEYCRITDNVAPKPVDNYVLDGHLGHGGGAAFEQTAFVKFENCLIADNEAAIGGGLYWQDDAPVIVDCNVLTNEAFLGGGLYATGGIANIRGCLISGNYAGPTKVNPGQFEPPEIIGQGGGIYSTSMVASIQDCTISDNEAQASGGGIFFSGTDSDHPELDNCLVVNNMAGRDGGGISVNWYATPKLSNCTIADNDATGDFGETASDSIGGGIYCGYDSNVEIIDSILWQNYANTGRQIAVCVGFELLDPPEPLTTLTISHSNIMGGYAELSVEVDLDRGCVLNWETGNINENPLFVTGPSGDYYLSQIAANNPADPWPAQTQDSPAVDAGSDYANNLGMHEYTTRTDDAADAFDKGMVDMGYHYQLIKSIEGCRIADVFADGRIDIGDLAEISMYWFRQNCSSGNGWCGATDFNEDTKVDSKDLVFMVKCWLVEDTEPPVPDPAEWAVEPYVVADDTVSMTAQTASDDWWGDQVEYFFDETTGNPGGTDSGWRQGYDSGLPNYFAEPHIWTDTGLTPATQYTYRVIVRDISGLQTQPSSEIPVVPGGDIDPPEPVWWATKVLDGIYGLPYPTSPTTIRMVAHVAIDPPPHSSDVQYRFRGVIGTRAGNEELQSEWQDSTQWNVTVADIYLGGYTFEFQVRDSSNIQSEWSQQATAPMIDLDWTAPYPTGGDPGNPAEWLTYPKSYLGVGSQYHHLMEADVGVDPEGAGVLYEFELVDGQGQGSGGPQIDPMHDVVVGTDVAGTYRVRYVDDSPLENESLWSTTESTHQQ